MSLVLLVLMFPFAVAACGGGGGGDGENGGGSKGLPGKGEACMGLLGLQCQDGLYCDVEDFSCGAADQTGICKDIPQVCTQDFAPVCGCDDKTYSNACTAAANSVSLVSLGACS